MLTFSRELAMTKRGRELWGTMFPLRVPASEPDRSRAVHDSDEIND